MTRNIALIRGDGIGPEIVGQAKLVLDRIAELYGHEFVLLRKNAATTEHSQQQQHDDMPFVLNSLHIKTLLINKL